MQEKVFSIEFGWTVFYKLTVIVVPNIVVRGTDLVNPIRVRIVEYNMPHCFGFVILLIHFVLIGLIATPGYAESSAVRGDHIPVYPLKQTLGKKPPDQPSPAGYPASTTLLAQAWVPVLDEEPLGEDDKSRETTETIEPVTRMVPIWGEKVRQKGFDLPLPFGVGTNLVYMNQGIKLKNVKVGVDEPIFEVEGLYFKDARAHDRANTARLDVWLLPFANVYGIFGYINGQAEMDLDISRIVGELPFPLPPIFEPGKTVDLNIDYNGTTFGGGMTLAGGYKDFFASVDGNYTYSNVDVVDAKIETYTISPRLGLLVDSAAIPGSLALWVGAMYMRYKQTITDDVNLQEFDSRLPSVEIKFKLDIENEEPWNFLFGGQWEITKRWQFMAEGGVGNRNQVITGLYFRF